MLNHLLQQLPGKQQRPIDDAEAGDEDTDQLLPSALRGFLSGSKTVDNKLDLKASGCQNNDDEMSAATGRLSSLFQASEADPWLPTMSRRQRLIGFVSCLLGAVVCMSVALFLCLPLVATRRGARRFVLLHCLASLLLLASLFSLIGPTRLFRALFCQASRLPLAIGYLGGVIGGLVGVLVYRSALLALLALAVQTGVVALATANAVPGGRTGLWLMVRAGWSMMTGAARTLLPV